MDCNGAASVIHKVLDRQGLLWLLDSLAYVEDDVSRTECSRTSSMDTHPTFFTYPTEDVGEPSGIITENGADLTYLINCAPDSFMGVLPCSSDLFSMKSLYHSITPLRSYQAGCYTCRLTHSAFTRFCETSRTTAEFWKKRFHEK